MLNTRFFISTLLVSSFLIVNAQTKSKFSINLIPKFGDYNLQLDTVFYKLPNKIDSVSFSNLKFYVTNIIFLQNKKVVYKEKNSYHLIDCKNIVSQKIDIQITSKKLIFNSIEFCLGVDSVINTKGFFYKDLDPVKGMYWAWHSGFINFKLEGNSNLCNTRYNNFQFHLGGFKHPFNGLQKVNFLNASAKEINIKFDVLKFLNQVDLSKTNEIMTPSKHANELLKFAAQSFSLL